MRSKSDSLTCITASKLSLFRSMFGRRAVIGDPPPRDRIATTVAVDSTGQDRHDPRYWVKAPISLDATWASRRDEGIDHAMRTIRAGRTTAVAVFAAALAVMLSACTRTTMDLTVSSDDTISGTIISAYSQELIDAIGEDAGLEVTDKDLEDARDDFPDDATVERYDQDGYTGMKVTFAQMPLSEFDSGDLGTGDDESFRIVRDGDFFVVSGKMDLSDYDPDEMASLGGTVEIPDQEPEIRVSITFPGEITDAPGAAIDGTTATWTPVLGEVTDFTATAKATGGSLLWILWVVLGVVVLAGIAVGVLLLVRSQSRKSGHGAPGQYPGQYPGGPAPQYPGGAQPYAGQPGPQHPGQAQPPYPGQGHPGQPQYPGQPQAAPGHYPGQPQAAPGQYPGHPGQPSHGGQPYPGQPQAPGQYPGHPGPGYQPPAAPGQQYGVPPQAPPGAPPQAPGGPQPPHPMP